MNLGCLDGSGDVTLAANGRPMIVSFWASYCGPCQAESPQLEAFAKAANGGVEVVGVDTADIDSKGRSFVAGLGLTYPMVADPDTRLLKAVAKPYLPTLLFVTSQGRIAHSYQKNQLDVATLRTLTSTYLGVQVSG